MNKHNGKDSSMIWMMLPCFLLLGILSFSGGTLFSSRYFRLFVIGVFMAFYLWKVFKSGRRKNNQHSIHGVLETSSSGASESTEDGHKGHGCCH